MMLFKNENRGNNIHNFPLRLCDELVQCVPTKKGHHILYKGYTYVFKSRLQCGAEQWCCSYRQKTGCISVINMQTYGVEVKFQEMKSSGVYILLSEFVTMRNMKVRFYYQGYIYYSKNKSSRWNCVSYPRCKAFVVLDGLNVVAKDLFHSHCERVLLRAFDGTYTSVSRITQPYALL